MGPSHVGVRPGDGLVARFADSIIVIGGDVDGATAGAVVDALEASSARGADAGRAMAGRLAALLADGELPAFGLVAPAGEGIVVLVHGTAEAEITSPSGTRTIAGGGSLTWHDLVLPPPVHQVGLRVAPTSAPADPRSDLRAGQLSGDGFVITFDTADTAPPAADVVPGPGAPAPVGDGPTASAAPAARATIVRAPAATTTSVTAATPATATPATIPTPAATPTPATATPAASAPVAPDPAPAVTAEAPAARATVVRARPTPAAATAAPATRVSPPAPTAPGPSEPTGAVDGGGATAPVPPRAAAATVARVLPTGCLVADDGSRILLDRSYVLGREPHNDPACLDGSATPIVVDDPDGVISRVQAHLSVTGDTVQVRDAGSANGTFVAAPGAEAWTRLDDRMTPLPVGWSLRIGKRIFTYVGLSG